MQNFFSFKTVAIVGASRTPNKDSNNIIRNLTLQKGLKIFPINPSATKILGLKAYPSVLDIKEDLDLAIIFIPPTRVLEVVKECVQKKVKAILIESSGFNEVGDLELFNEIKQITSNAGIRVWGPNCTGYVDFHQQLFTPFVPLKPVLRDIDIEELKGSVSIASQSGMMAGGMMLQIITGNPLKQYAPVNKILAIGNKLDVNECDALEYMGKDSKTKVIGLYLEGFIDARKFFKLAREIVKEKPIILLKGGTSKSGSQAALSHTGSLSTNDNILDGAIRQTGIIRVYDFKEFLQVLHTFSILLDNGKDLPKDNRVAIVTISGGAGVVLSDNVEKSKDLKMAVYEEKTLKRISKNFPDWMKRGKNNPCDIWPAIDKSGGGALVDTLSALSRDKNVDVIILTIIAVRERGWDMAGNPMFVEILKSFKKPIFCWIFGDFTQFDNFRKMMVNIGIPFFTSIKDLTNSLSKVVEYANFISKK
ncbi:MAG: CoA-binding protein [Candidatus Helarchaeota archaeon]|nr:CoA-binding protein [Candidatus Helarchaeota archaeon]